MQRGLPVLIAALFLAPALAGCVLFSDEAGHARVDAPVWRPGDLWVFSRTAGNGEELIYEREVTAYFMHQAGMVYELRSGLRSHPVQDHHLYRSDDLRFVGTDTRDGTHLLKRVMAEEPVVFHYVFPLVPGERTVHEGDLTQRVAAHEQHDPVRVSAAVDPAVTLTLGERSYEVVPYEIRIEFLATPFADEAVIRGHWSSDVGQSVLTTITEGGDTIRYELLYFERQDPVRGPPAYTLVPPLSTHHLERGFETRLPESGWERYLFHVEDPVRVGIHVTVPGASGTGDRLDVVSLRPLGYTRAGIADQLSDLATGGLFLHVSAHGADGPVVHHHAAEGAQNDRVDLQPGQVYELIVASDKGPVNVRVEHTHEFQAFPPAETGAVEILSGAHEVVTEVTPPGPQSVSDSLSATVANPDNERIEGVVYVVNHGGADQALGEYEAKREVFLAVDAWGWRDPKELYAYYFGYVPRDGFQVHTGFEYQAVLALQGAVDYELGILLLKLLPG